MKALLEYSTGEVWGHDHRLPDEDGTYVLMLRDPMDTFWSHWRLYQHDNPDQCTELRFVDILMRGQMESHRGWNIGWVPYIQGLLGWHDAHPETALLVRYEQLSAAPDHTLAEVLDRLGKAPCYGRIASAIHQTLGARCDPSSLPVTPEMGKAGQWRTALQPATICALLGYCGPTMQELGYL